MTRKKKDATVSFVITAESIDNYIFGILFFSTRHKLRNVSRGLVKIHEEVKRQKFSLGKLKGSAVQNQQLLTTEYKALASQVKTAVDYLNSLEKCDGSCVHIKPLYQSKLSCFV